MFFGLFVLLILEFSFLVCKRRLRLVFLVDFYMFDIIRLGIDRDFMWLFKIGKGSVERLFRVFKNI